MRVYEFFNVDFLKLFLHMFKASGFKLEQRLESNEYPYCAVGISPAEAIAEILFPRTPSNKNIQYMTMLILSQEYRDHLKEAFKYSDVSVEVVYVPTEAKFWLTLTHGDLSHKFSIDYRLSMYARASLCAALKASVEFEDEHLLVNTAVHVEVLDPLFRDVSIPGLRELLLSYPYIDLNSKPTGGF